MSVVISLEVAAASVSAAWNRAADTIVWLGGAPEAIQTTGLFWHDRRPRPATYLIGAGADDDATRRELWDHVATLARRPQARPA
jgi:hypothetical protein